MGDEERHLLATINAHSILMILALGVQEWFLFIMLLLIQVLFTIVAAAFAAHPDCPPSEKLYPCSCGDHEGLPVVNCEGFDSLSELEQAVTNTVGYNVSFRFIRCNLIDIPSDFFKGHTSTRLIFEDCKIRSFGDKPFSGLEKSLTGLYIYQSIDKKITQLDTLQFSHLENLQYFSAAYNDIGHLGGNWFRDGPESLTQLDMDENKIESADDKVFNSLVNLQQLYVGGNRIRQVARSMLPNPMKDLWLLEVKGNLIEELPEDAFDGYLSRYLTVNFADNKLRSIPENVWGKIWSKLQAVYLEGNDILCDGNIKWIYNQELPQTFEGKCGPGNDLQGKELKSLTLEDFQ